MVWIAPIASALCCSSCWAIVFIQFSAGSAGAVRADRQDPASKASNAPAETIRPAASCDGQRICFLLQQRDNMDYTRTRSLYLRLSAFGQRPEEAFSTPFLFTKLVSILMCGWNVPACPFDSD